MLVVISIISTYSDGLLLGTKAILLHFISSKEFSSKVGVSDASSSS